MNYKKILLLVASLLIILIFFYPTGKDSQDQRFTYDNWLESKILNSFGFADNQNEWDQFSFQVEHLDIEKRRSARLGGTYSFCQNLKRFFEEQKVKDPLVLLPPQEFIKANNIDLLIPEPIVFYYECGLKGAQVTSANVSKSNWSIVPDGRGGLTPVEITTKAQLDTLISAFSKYKQ